MNWPTWGSLGDSAKRQMQSRIDSIPTWGDVLDTPAVYVQSVKSDWAWLGKSDDEINAEAKRRFFENGEK